MSVVNVLYVAVITYECVLFFLLLYFFFFLLCFFFQAEDGIRDRDVTGVQTCVFRSRRIQ